MFQWIQVDLHLHFGSAEYGAALALSEGLQEGLGRHGDTRGSLHPDEKRGPIFLMVYLGFNYKIPKFFLCMVCIYLPFTTKINKTRCSSHFDYIMG